MVDLNATTPSVGSVTFSATSDYAIQNGGLTLGGNVANNNSGRVEFATNVTLSVSGSRTFSGNVSGEVRFDSSIGGTGGITVAGGLYTLARPAGYANPLSGNVHVTGGTLKVVSSDYGNLTCQTDFDALGSGSLTINGGRVELIAEDPLGTIINLKKA
jgi:hypothetical protein